MEDKYVVGIRFKKAGKKYYFDPNGLYLRVCDKVIVETVRGIELGEVIEAVKKIYEDELVSTLKPVIRKATNKDIKQYERNIKDQPIVLNKCLKFIKKNELVMKLLGCEYTLDRSKLIIYFNADERVDFRELVKDLANEFRVRIELRQVGTRDGAKFLGGIGPCGLLLCCNTFLGEFNAVSIKMAKNQNLSLNPTNISGLCGKLLCCIKYEDDIYTERKKGLPKLNSYVETKESKGRVIGINVLEQSVKIMTDENIVEKYNLNEIKTQHTEVEDINDEVINELKELEE